VITKKKKKYHLFKKLYSLVLDKLELKKILFKLKFKKRIKLWRFLHKRFKFKDIYGRYSKNLSEINSDFLWKSEEDFLNRKVKRVIGYVDVILNFIIKKK
jgi:hypothetical protein